jgi:predicted alpha/beta-hydrolase family hydrolase
VNGVDVALPSGVVRVSAALDAPERPWAAVALAHGAGAGMDHPFLVGFARALVEAGVAAMRFAFPYSEAGRRMPGPAAHAVATWREVVPALRGAVTGVPVFAAGKSYGGRMASMAAADDVIDPAGLIYLGYPLHPPGEPEKRRVEHLPRIAAPQLFVEGDRDPFIQPLAGFEEAVASCRRAEVVWVPGGGHSFEVAGRRTAADVVGAELTASVLPWLRERAAD